MYKRNPSPASRVGVGWELSVAMNLHKPLERLFLAYSKFLVAHHWVLIGCSLLVTSLLSLGLLRWNELNITDSEYICTPTNALSYKEQAVVERLWPLNVSEFLPNRQFDSQYFAWIILQCKDECNIFDLTEVLQEIDEFITSNVTITSGRSYSDLCMSYDGRCPTFEPLFQLFTSNSSITYPTFSPQDPIFPPVYLGYSLGGVTTTNFPTNMVISATAVRMMYFLRGDTADYRRDAEEWENKMESVVDRGYPTMPNASLFRSSIFHSRSVDQGVHENLIATVPVLPMTVVALLIFCIPFMMALNDSNQVHGFTDASGGMIDWVRSKPLLAPVGLLTAGMGIASGTGILMLFGYEFPDVSIVTPFLVLSIGVDDMFLLANAWQLTNRAHSLQSRMGEALSEAAVAITITSVTDCLSFFVGCISSIPAVRYFCAYAGMCIAFNYIYQITFFAAVMVVMGKWEHENLLSIAPCVTNGELTVLSRPPSGAKVADSKTAPVTSERPTTPITMDVDKSCIGYKYGMFLLNPITKTIIILIYGVYIGLSTWGISTIKEGLDYADLLMPQNKFINYLNMEQQLFSGGPQALVVVQNPPDLSLAQNRIKMLNISSRFDSSVYILNGGTQFWLESFENSIGNRSEGEAWYEALDNFLNISTSLDIPWAKDILWSNVGKIRAFRFLISLKNITDPKLWKSSLSEFRKIASKFSEYGVITYGGLFWKTGDQYLAVIPGTLTTTGVALISMLIVSLLLIPSPLSSLWIGLTVISIDIGVVGLMSLWGINLDYIAMITIIMSIGFSVDFAAHITYAYVCAPTNHVPLKIITSLHKTGLPLFKAAASTIVGVGTLYLTGSNMIIIFMKTVLLVILVGVVHALVFLPVFLAVFMPLLYKYSCKGAQFKVKTVQNQRTDLGKF